MDTYSHAIPGLQEDAAQRIDAALRSALPSASVAICIYLVQPECFFFSSFLSVQLRIALAARHNAEHAAKP